QAALLAHDAAIAVDIADGCILYLAFTATTHQLSDPFDDVAHAASQAGLPKGELPAVGVTGKIALVAEVMFLNKPATFALLAETRIFERNEHGDGVAIIGLHEVHIFRRDPGHFECRFRRRLDERGSEAARTRNTAMPSRLPSAQEIHRPIGRL